MHSVSHKLKHTAMPLTMPLPLPSLSFKIGYLHIKLVQIVLKSPEDGFIVCTIIRVANELMISSRAFLVGIPDWIDKVVSLENRDGIMSFSAQPGRG